MFELQKIAELAAKYVNTTDRHIFLTGKAGTGKTTFLKYIIEHTYKNAVVAAPTGIAAINAGGVTLHSLLQLPFGTFIPENIPFSDSNSQINVPASLFRETRFNSSKRELIKELELLIIDEVSMLRADLLDCIDHTLRYLRKRKHEPFGGLQILFIGDLLQLPPVVKDQAELLKRYYKSNYFFDAIALNEQPPIRVELQKIFRQTDQDFIDLLNRIRNNEQTEEDTHLLNKHYHPSMDNNEMEGYIHLTTHNMKADRYNKSRLYNIEGEFVHYQAVISSDFPENMYPTAPKLTLKKGAQVMFIKNDPSGQGQFFNGKIGMVSRLESDTIWVKDESGTEISVETYQWENKRYVLNSSNQEIEEKNMGSFEQYPLKLAWAVTIHKSQGLTFERAILDLSGSFAPGQLYVALSRLTSMKGLVLSSPIPESPPEIDASLKKFVGNFHDSQDLHRRLHKDQRVFLHNFAKQAFDFEPLLRELGYHQRSFDKGENRSLKQKHLPWTRQLIGDTYPLKDVGDTFVRQVAQLVKEDEFLLLMMDRLDKAQSYFEPLISTLAGRVQTQYKSMKGVKNVKTYVKELAEVELLYRKQNKQILKLTMLVRQSVDKKNLTKQDLRKTDVYKAAMTSGKSKIFGVRKKKIDKISTSLISYELYKQGKTIEDIAEERQLVKRTIEGHLASYVESGHLDINDFLKPLRLEKILDIYNKGITNSKKIKDQLNDDFTYTEIKLAQAYAKSLEAG